MEQDELHALALLEVDAVFRLAYHLPGHSLDADGLVLKTFSIALASRADVEPTAEAVRRFLFKILYEAVLHQSLTKPARPLGTPSTPAEVTTSESEPGPTLASTSSDELAQNKRLTHAIWALPLAHRAVFLLCLVEELKYREAAYVMGLHTDDVRVLLTDARAALPAHLAQPLPAGPEGDESRKPEMDRDPKVLE